MKVGWQGLVAGVITAFLISCCLLSAGIFLSDVYFFSGINHLVKGEILASALDLAIATKINPYDCKARYYLAQVCYRTGDNRSAVKYCDEILKRAPYYLRTRELKNLATPKKGIQ